MSLVCLVVFLVCFKAGFLKQLSCHKQPREHSFILLCGCHLVSRKSSRPSELGGKFLNGGTFSQCFRYAQRAGRFDCVFLDSLTISFCSCCGHQFWFWGGRNLFLSSLGLIFMDHWPNGLLNTWTDEQLRTVLSDLLEELFSRLLTRLARPPLRQPYRCGYQCAFCEAACTRADEGH